MELEHQLCNLSESLTRCLRPFAEQDVSAISNVRRLRRPVQNVSLRLGPVVVAQLVADYQAGWSIKLVAERYKISKASVLKLLADHHVPTRKSGVNYEYLPEDLRRRA